MLPDPSPSNHEPVWPNVSELAEVRFIEPPHPSLISEEELVGQCRVTSHRRGGPGGQHRNKVSSAVMILHEPTKISAEASERRDQSQNRRVAIERLRVRFAMLLRSQQRTSQVETPIPGLAICEEEDELRRRWRSRPLKIAESNFDRAGILALLLDDLHRSGGQPSLVASLWDTSTTSVVQFIRSQPAAFQLLNQWRIHHGRQPLRHS